MGALQTQRTVEPGVPSLVLGPGPGACSAEMRRSLICWNILVAGWRPVCQRDERVSGTVTGQLGGRGELSPLVMVRLWAAPQPASHQSAPRGETGVETCM